MRKLLHCPSRSLVLQAYILFIISVGSHASCDLSGAAWPESLWRDIIRGTSVQACDQTKVGNGYCDYVNDMASDSCGMDGGDCCFTTCISNCVSLQTVGRTYVGDIPYLDPSAGVVAGCAHMCGVRASPSTNCPYLCLADDYMHVGSSLSSWCSSGRGVKTQMSQCFSTQAQIVKLLQDCFLDDRSHGNTFTAHVRCGNQTGDCTLADMEARRDGCELHPSLCTQSSCCSLAISSNWIDPQIPALPSACEIAATCSQDSLCYPALAQCARTNKACQGGCCMCSALQWYGPNCDQPLCNPRCKNGRCVAPNMCACDPGFSGPSCEVPVCNPNCVGGQGVCISPNQCECFYGWSGPMCETPVSNPPCLNGEAVAPDMCRCDPGWGGRVCDYPICQSYPIISSDCDKGVCDSPWTCKCDPEWTETVALDASGMKILPFFWKGRDVSSVITPADFVFGDTRFNQTSISQYFFSQYNAYKCSTGKDCRLVADPFCVSCMHSECTECESGFFLSPTKNCKRCNTAIEKCARCSTVGGSVVYCTSCDPLFALVKGACISSGIIEFSSDRYNVGSRNEFFDIPVIRTNPEPESTSPVNLIVQTIAGGSAVWKSATGLSDFQFTRTKMTLGGPDNYQTVRVAVFDNARVDQEKLFFNVSIYLDPGTVSGSSLPLSGNDLVNNEPLVTASVYIWDVSGVDQSRCELRKNPISVFCNVFDFNANSWTSFRSSSIDDVAVITNTAFGSTIQFVSSGPGSNANVFDSNDFLLLNPIIPPTNNVVYSVAVQIGHVGVLAQQFLLTANPSPGQAPDIKRIEPRIQSNWTLTQDAPARITYSGYLYFGPDSIPPSSIALAVSEGAKVVASFGSFFNAINAQRAVDPSDSDDVWKAPSNTDSITCGSNIFCFTHSFSPNSIIKFDVTFQPSQLFFQRPAGINMLFLRNGAWEIAPSEHLMAGLDVPNSPIRALTT